MSLKALISRFLPGASASNGNVVVHGSNTGSIIVINGVVQTSGGGGSGGYEVKGSGSAASDARAATPFESIKAGSIFTVNWTAGPPSIQVVAQPNLLPLIETTIDARGELAIRALESFSSDRPVEVRCSSPVLTAIRLSGAATGALHDVAGPKFLADTAGAASLTLAGSCGDFQLEASGSSDVDATGFACDALRASMSGASTASASFATSAEARVSGSASLAISGSAALRATLTGSAELVHESGSCSGSVDASGASTARLNLSGACELDASGAATISYSGAPAPLNSRATGAGTIRPTSRQPKLR